MASVDWNAKTVLHQRDDAGSDMHVAFETIAEGTLAAMVRRVRAMPVHDRARVVLDIAGVGTLDIGRVMELSEHSDLPAE